MSSRPDIARYTALIDELLATPPAFTPETETPTALQVERGVLYPTLLKTPSFPPATPLDPLIDLAQANRTEQIAIIDCRSHRRPFYLSLLLYAWARSLQLAPAPQPHHQALRLWCTPLEHHLTSLPWGSTLPASLGEQIAAAAWSALTLHVASQVLHHAPWQTQAAHVFSALVHSQQSNGSFLHPSSSDNPETYWYHELVILHAIASFAAQPLDPTILAAVARNAEFHQNETQPDHATSQPLALSAFIANPSTHPLADQVLHSVRIQHPAGPQGLASILLADTLHSLRQLP